MSPPGLPSDTRLIGRQSELSHLRHLFGAGHRLVTLTGPGGIGKTALALTYADRAASEPPGELRVWRCELTVVRDVAGICESVGRAVGVDAAGGSTPEVAIARLCRVLAAHGRCLLLLDGFEHLVEHAAATIGRWLADVPDLCALVTSRELLHIDREIRLDVPPLSLPADGARAEEAESVQLFIERVQALDPAFALHADAAPVVAEVMRQLEGIPLAIELAASRLEVLGLAGLLAGLKTRLDILARTARDRAGRLSTLRAAIDWSWSLLDPTERAVLALCTLFRGGFSVAAARAVLAPVAAGRPVLDVLHSLRDKSVLRMDASGLAPGHARFTMFEAIREFAAEKLAEVPERDAARARHAMFYLAAGQAWAAGVNGADGSACLRDLALERDNLLRVHEDALADLPAASDAATRVLRSALILDTLDEVQGPRASHLRLLDAALARTEDSPAEPLLRRRVLRARARARWTCGLVAAAERDLELALAGAPEDPALRAALLADLGVICHQRRDLQAAREYYHRALELARVAYDRHTEARVLGNLAAMFHDQKALEQARSHYHAVLDLVRELGVRRLEAIHIANLGVLEQESGGRERARAHFETATELLGALGDRRIAAIVASNHATLEHEEGQLEAARQRHEQALAWLREVGDPRSEALCLSRLGRVNADLGWVEDARACISAAERLLSRYPDALAQQAVHLDYAFIELAEARRAAAADPEVVRVKHESVLRRLAAARGSPGPGELPWSERSDDIRAAIRMLERALRTFDRPTVQESERWRAALVLGPEARWFRAPGEPVQDFRRRGPLRRILLHLVERQREAPGVGSPLSTLLAVGWPDERMTPEAGANRVYVGLATLRKFGMRRSLLSQDDGYLLDPALPIIRASAEEYEEYSAH